MKTEILFLAGMCLCACSRTPQEQTSFPRVKVVHAEVMEAPSLRCYTFISQPYRLSELSFRVGGLVHAFDVQQGQFFRKGQLIAAIDERDFVIQKQRTEALYRQAEVDYARISSLYAKDNISGMNYEQAKANYERTKADYEAAVNAWEDSRLYAPFDGYVQQAHIERYQDVKPSVPVVTFIDLSRIKVEAYVPEDMALQMRQKDSVACVVRFNALPDREFVPSEYFLTQRMSLAAIIIAMGMLVDNAIVVYDAALVNMQRGMRKRKAILDAVSGTSMPLLGATLIAVLTFLPVYLSPHITGEILSSLFIVIAVSLLLSWVLAITQNVFFVQEFVRRPRPDELKGELFSGRAYDLFRQALRWTIQRRYVVLGAMVLLLVIAGWGFRFIPQQFMPLLNKQYFSVDVWLPEGTRIEENDRQMTEMTAYLNSLEGVKKVSSFVGQTPPRYYLANAAYGPQPNYAQCLVEADTPEKSRELQAMLYDRLPAMFPDALVRVNSFEINSIPQALIEARFCGDDPEVLDSLTNLALEIMRKNPKVLNARNEWGNMALMIKADYDPVKAGRLNVGRHDMMNAVKAVNDGTAVGVYRDRDKKVPVLLHTDVKGSWDMESVEDLPIWNGRNSASLGQVANGIGLAWEYPLVRTYDRKLSMAALTKYFPLALIMLLVILVMLFGNFRQPLIIFLILPLSLIGMVFGLWVTGFQFGFFCIAGWLGLLGMIIKNVIVLLDEVNIQQKAGVEPYTAVIEATVSRARPVLMAALTTVFGLSFATLLTLFVTPALYTVFYKISKRGE
ncbi:efflux RND transporter permease subunit [Phocaeicola plebeius]|jgi:multidrug efflux pump subunit AcrB|uniref:efflux RND transporter permease subunit n=1 Tax=Phocaeicola plebeius TaxID=310297 RepID=UPI000E5CAF9D|nr:efflux RND transporter permease subunit [Phocaeicola plebeius]RGR50299.1 efflux RND transporter periplasmic adaptor subunit [Phocaeicola plebeius]